MINNIGEALGVLVQAAEIGIKGGLFDIREVKLITESIEFINPNYFNNTENIPPENAPTENIPPENAPKAKKEYIM